MAYPDPLLSAIDKNDVVALKRILTSAECPVDRSPIVRRLKSVTNPLTRYAFFKQSFECALLLIEHGAYLDQFEFSRAALRGNIALMESAIRYGYDVTTFPLDSILDVPRREEVMKLLLANGAKINAVKWDGNPPLHTACMGTNLDAVECLIRHGADVNLLDIRGKTPLHSTMSGRMGSQKEAIARILIANGARVENRDGGTLLHYLECSYNPRPEFVEEILEIVANIDAQNASGHTALHCAVHCPRVVSLYLNRLANINIELVNGLTPLGHVEHLMVNLTDHYFDRMDRGEQVNSWSLSKEYLIQHIVKLEAAGFCVSEKNLKLAEPHRKLMPFTDQDCRLELRKFKLNTGISLHDFLTSTMYPDYLHNKDLSRKLSQLDNFAYPIYIGLVKDKFERDNRRFTLLEHCRALISDLPMELPPLPDEMWKKILLNLNNDDLKGLESTLAATRDTKVGSLDTNIGGCQPEDFHPR